MTTTLCIDGDYLVYKMGFAVETVIQWDEGDILVPYASVEESKTALDLELQRLRERLQADEVLVALSDLKANWRKSVYPEYKATRTGPRRRPMPFHVMREYLFDVYKAIEYPTLEADDVLGILMTEPHTDKRILVGEDKDFGTIPGSWYNPEKDILRDVTLEEADRTHLIQTLMGDQVDNYPGIRGCGPKTAAKILTENNWEIVVQAYKDAGMTDIDALVMARCARILRHGEYDKKRKEVKLWEPE